jgi:hypothetical protein
MMKQLVLATLLASTATFAYAQTTSPSPSPSSKPAPSATSTAPQTASAERTVSTGDFDKNGNMSGNALIGAKVKNANNDTVGSIDDIYLDKDGSTKMVIISVGGFLGVGSKAVAVKWSDIEYGKDNDSLKLTTNLTKDQLKGMPDFTASERRKPAPATETSSAPAMKR